MKSYDFNAAIRAGQEVATFGLLIGGPDVALAGLVDGLRRTINTLTTNEAVKDPATFALLTATLSGLERVKQTAKWKSDPRKMVMSVAVAATLAMETASVLDAILDDEHDSSVRTAA